MTRAIKGIPLDLCTRTWNILRDGIRITTMKQLLAMTADEYLSVHNAGVRSLLELNEQLEMYEYPIKIPVEKENLVKYIEREKELYPAKYMKEQITEAETLLNEVWKRVDEQYPQQSHGIKTKIGEYFIKYNGK